MRSVLAPALAGVLLLGGVPGSVAPGPEAAPGSWQQLAGADAVGTPATTKATAETPTQDASPADVRPRMASVVEPLAGVQGAQLPTPAGMTEQLREAVSSRWLGPSNRRAVEVRDALTGETLAESNARRPVTPASTTKLLAAAAVVTSLSTEETFTTRVVAGAEPGQVVIVAGGDMLLGDGPGDPEAVAGHAGIGDLAAQTARALQDQQGQGEAEGAEAPVSVALDLSHVEGPHAMPSWSEHWVDEGWSGRIVQLGRAGDRALPSNPSPAEPEQEVARVFREALAAQGVDVQDADDDEATAPRAAAPEGAVELASVDSAALRDVLALALATSDNAMVEQLARQAAVADGQSADQESVTAWITRSMVEDYDIDMTGMRIADASGLSDGTLLSMEAVAAVLVAGSDGSHPALQEVLAAGGLPIAGYTGTLGNGRRFHLPVHAPAVGNARAKTGTLPGVTALGGTVVTADGRLLVYALAADDIGTGAEAVEAASVLDEIVAELARCGC